MKPFTISEDQWQHQVQHLARMLGWRHMHVRRSRARRDQWATTTSVAGWPDLTLWHETQQRLIVAELKSDTGRVSPDQRTVLLSLEAAGTPAYILRPRDLDTTRQILTDPTAGAHLRATHLLRSTR